MVASVTERRQPVCPSFVKTDKATHPEILKQKAQVISERMRHFNRNLKNCRSLIARDLFILWILPHKHV